MSFHVFDFDMVDKDSLVVLPGQRLVRILTGNDMDSDYCLVPGDMGDEELEDELRLTFRKKHGNSSFGPSYQGYEDMSWMLDDLT